MNNFRPFIWAVLIIIAVVLIIPSILVGLSSDNIKQVSQESTEKKVVVTSNDSNESTIEVSVYRTSTKEIEKVQLEEYVVGVVASEMPVSFELEALKAQSLAARTFIFNRMLSDSKVGMPSNVDVDITDNPEFHQVYKNREELAKLWGENYISYISKVQKAVNATKDQILTYDGNPIDPSFFSTSNGYTENSEDYWSDSIPYLRSVESPWDKESPVYNGQKVMKIEDVEKALEINLEPNEDNIGEIKLTDSKRVDIINIGNKEFSGVFIREELDLPSNDFEIQQKDGNFIFTTKGNGHGVGMSQYGANGMAKEGKTFNDIVNYYYQDVSISSVGPFVNTIVVKK